jgi:hypothetical protein
VRALGALGAAIAACWSTQRGRSYKFSNGKGRGNSKPRPDASRPGISSARICGTRPSRETSQRTPSSRIDGVSYSYLRASYAGETMSLAAFWIRDVTVGALLVRITDFPHVPNYHAPRMRLVDCSVATVVSSADAQGDRRPGHRLSWRCFVCIGLRGRIPHLGMIFSSARRYVLIPWSCHISGREREIPKLERV